MQTRQNTSAISCSSYVSHSGVLMHIATDCFVGQARSRALNDATCLPSCYTFLLLRLVTSPSSCLGLRIQAGRLLSLVEVVKTHSTGLFLRAKPDHSNPRDEQEPGVTLPELPGTELLIPGCASQKTSLVGNVPSRLALHSLFPSSYLTS